MDPRVKQVIDGLANQFEDAAAERQRTGTPFDTDTAAMAAGPESAGFLNLLVRALDAKTVVEVGTSFGYTALWLGEAARDTGGKVIGTEAVETKRARATASIEEAGLSDVVDIRLGDAKEVVRNIDGPIDLAFVDAWKSDYPDYFDALLPNLRIGGVIVADNIIYPESARDSARAYQAHVRAHPNVRSQELTIGSGLEMTVKTG